MLRGDVGPPPKDSKRRSKVGQSCFPFTFLPIPFCFHVVMFRQLCTYIFALGSDFGLGTEALLKVKLNE